MDVIHETRPEFQTLSPAEILRRVLKSPFSRSPGVTRFLGSRSRFRRLSRGYEMADFRPYVPGDDTRNLDWAALARLDQTIVRLVAAQDENPQIIILDASKSMALGRPSKWSAACWAVTDIAAHGFAHGESVGVNLMGENDVRPIRRLNRIQHTADLIGLILALRKITPGGISDASHGIRFCAAGAAAPAALTVISDFLPAAPTLPGGWKRRINLIRVLSPVEIDPTEILSGELMDMETGEKMFPRHDAAALASYRSALEDHRRAIAHLARSTAGVAIDVRA